MPAPVAAAAPRARVARFVVAHVRQALQQAVAVGAASLYLAAACSIRPCHAAFMASLYCGQEARSSEERRTTVTDAGSRPPSAGGSCWSKSGFCPRR